MGKGRKPARAANMLANRVMGTDYRAQGVKEKRLFAGWPVSGLSKDRSHRCRIGNDGAEKPILFQQFVEASVALVYLWLNRLA
jgi:hypothetical protein